MHTSHSYFRHADYHVAPVICTCCMVSMLSLSGCTHTAQESNIDDHAMYPTPAPSNNSDGNCIEDDFC